MYLLQRFFRYVDGWSRFDKYVLCYNNDMNNSEWSALDLGQNTIVAHELKSPLALIRQMSLFLAQNQLEPAKTQRYLQQIVATSERALRLTNGLSRLANLDQLPLNLEPINVAELCKQVEVELNPLFKLHQKRLLVRKKRRQYLAVADHFLLKSVLIQFCDNALHYADARHPVKIEIAQTKQAIRVSVKDRGPRLPTAVWRQLNANRLAPQAIASRPQSSGIGLCIAQQFAEAMSAHIGAQSHTDGVSFYIDLMISNQLSLL